MKRRSKPAHPGGGYSLRKEVSKSGEFIPVTSVAATCGMLVKGWDATTEYLQTKQRVPVYA